jgi:hypothetical protein
METRIAAMSHTDTLTSPIQLACPHCRSTEHLRTVELVEVLTEATFSLGTTEPDYNGESQLLPDTQQWQPSGAIVCRNCDQVDLRYGDLIPAILLTGPTASPAGPTETPGATS